MYADWNEDELLLSLFPKGYQGYACEVGAYDGQTHSQTLLLEENGWTCLCIEPNPGVLEKLKKRRPFVMGVACASEPKESATFHIHLDNPEAHSGLEKVYHKVWHPEPGAQYATVEVPVRKLGDCLDDARFPRLDVLTIDTEGTELDVLKGCNLLRWHPAAIVVEAWDADNPIRPYLLTRGYRLIRRSGVNDCYASERIRDARQPAS